MKNLILKYWWVLVVLLALLEILSTWMLLSTSVFWANLIVILCMIAFLAVLVSWVYLLKSRKWWQFVGSFLISLIISSISALVSLFLVMYYPLNDPFGEKHPIPQGMEVCIPVEMESHEKPVADSLDTGSYLQVRNDFQGGLYLYDFYYGALPAGDIYLKCFEVTENIPLSADRMIEESKVSIEGTTSFSQLVSKKRFTIYEGDWGDYYAARIEVWHKDAATGEETELCEKTYRVEGWMR